jgi:hypothetical protein
MRLLSSRHLFITINILHLLCVAGAVDEDAIIPGQYIVYYKEDADRIATNQRLFFSSGIASSDSFQVLQELELGIAVTGITDEQY